MSRYVWGVALLVAVGGLIAVGSFSGKFGADESQESAPAPAPASTSTSTDQGSSSSSDASSIAATQTVSIKVPGMT